MPPYVKSWLSAMSCINIPVCGCNCFIAIQSMKLRRHASHQKYGSQREELGTASLTKMHLAMSKLHFKTFISFKSLIPVFLSEIFIHSWKIGMYVNILWAIHCLTVIFQFIFYWWMIPQILHSWKIGMYVNILWAIHCLTVIFQFFFLMNDPTNPI